MKNWKRRAFFIALGVLLAAVVLFYPIKSKPKYKVIVFRSMATYVLNDGRMIQVACNDTSKVELQYNNDTLIFKQWNRSIGFKPMGITNKTLIVRDNTSTPLQINLGNYKGGGQFAYFYYGGGVLFLYTLPKCFRL